MHCSYAIAWLVPLFEENMPSAYDLQPPTGFNAIAAAFHVAGTTGKDTPDLAAFVIDWMGLPRDGDAKAQMVQALLKPYAVAIDDPDIHQVRAWLDQRVWAHGAALIANAVFPPAAPVNAEQGA